MSSELTTSRFLALTGALICALALVLTGASGQANAGKHHHGNGHHKHKRNACKAWATEQPQRLTPPQARKAVACLLNRRRAKAHLPKLDVTKSLNRASQRHTDYMQRHNCFDHECSGEASLDSRLKKARYLKGGMTGWSYGENIAWGQEHLGTPQSMVKAWMHSSGHRANILNGDFRDLGIGFRTGSPSKRSANAGLYTTDFGFRKFG